MTRSDRANNVENDPERNIVDPLFRVSGTVKHDPATRAWLDDLPDDLRTIARHWFDVIHDCGDDVLEVLHDGHATACITDAAFAYVNVFKAHVNVGFFRGAALEDPAGLLQGTGKTMRHVKLRPGEPVQELALRTLIQSAYRDMKGCLSGQ